MSKNFRYEFFNDLVENVHDGIFEVVDFFRQLDIEVEKVRSTIKIKDLTGEDIAQYHTTYSGNCKRCPLSSFEGKCNPINKTNEEKTISRERMRVSRTNVIFSTTEFNNWIEQCYRGDAEMSKFFSNFGLVTEEIIETIKFTDMQISEVEEYCNNNCSKDNCSFYPCNMSPTIGNYLEFSNKNPDAIMKYTPIYRVCVPNPM